MRKSPGNFQTFTPKRIKCRDFWHILPGKYVGTMAKQQQQKHKKNAFALFTRGGWSAG